HVSNIAKVPNTPSAATASLSPVAAPPAPSASQATSRVGIAKLVLNLPDKLQLTVDDKTVSPSQREVVVPALEVGAIYEYQLRAVMERDGKQVIDARKIAFSAGDTVRIDFTTPPPSIAVAS